jgi:hypothetical protein
LIFLNSKGWRARTRGDIASCKSGLEKGRANGEQLALCAQVRVEAVCDSPKLGTTGFSFFGITLFLWLWSLRVVLLNSNTEGSQ